MSDHITWTGFTRDVAAELRQMDLLVLPSLFGEGLPMVVLEAMAAGVPVVATRVAGIPEAIRHGRDGVLVTPGDPEDLARAIADVVGGQYDWSALRRAPSPGTPGISPIAPWRGEWPRCIANCWTSEPLRKRSQQIEGRPSFLCFSLTPPRQPLFAVAKSPSQTVAETGLALCTANNPLWGPVHNRFSRAGRLS